MKNRIHKEYALELRQLMHDEKISQKDLAIEMGYTITSVWHVMNNPRMKKSTYYRYKIAILELALHKSKHSPFELPKEIEINGVLYKSKSK